MLLCALFITSKWLCNNCFCCCSGTRHGIGPLEIHTTSIGLCTSLRSLLYFPIADIVLSLLWLPTWKKFMLLPLSYTLYYGILNVTENNYKHVFFGLCPVFTWCHWITETPLCVKCKIKIKKRSNKSNEWAVRYAWLACYFSKGWRLRYTKTFAITSHNHNHPIPVWIAESVCKELW